jgi:hypothetical protein
VGNAEERVPRDALHLQKLRRPLQPLRRQEKGVRVEGGVQAEEVRPFEGAPLRACLGIKSLIVGAGLRRSFIMAFDCCGLFVVSNILPMCFLAIALICAGGVKYVQLRRASGPPEVRYPCGFKGTARNNVTYRLYRLMSAQALESEIASCYEVKAVECASEVKRLLSRNGIEANFFSE